MMPVFLPQTSFPMKGNLREQEPSWLQWWHHIDLYGQWRVQGKTKELFVLHDGPPYANGPIHLGHSLNKILKDFVNRWQHSKGRDVSFIPGWDCHGLPIETQIEKELLKEKKKRDDISVRQFRQNCRTFAQKWIDIQKEGFQRLGIVGDWKAPYTTMDYAFESSIVKQFFQLLANGYVYRGVRPVLWSAQEQTALAEAEVEYQDIVSQAIHVRFAIHYSPLAVLKDAFAVIWTTTPWSLPGNRAIAYASDAYYGVYAITGILPSSHGRVGEKLLVACDLWLTFCQEVGITGYTLLETIQGHQLELTQARHPWAGMGFDWEVPFIPSEYVTTDTGTGLVHTAPCHGLEDFTVGNRYQLDATSPLSKEGIFEDNIPVLAGIFMGKAYPLIKDLLLKTGTLLHESDYAHSYPHSWRSKKPLFYRTTPQWFIALDGTLQLRERALKALDTVTWHPKSAKTRMTTMLAKRPDWCISRQRVWGVPIATFIHGQTGEVLVDKKIFQRIAERIAQEGADFWFTDHAYDVLLPDYKKEDWIKNEDIIDVWFESGITHQAVLKEGIPKGAIGRTQWPASAYLEGSDQHRAWFQSSLAIGVALHDKAPYKSVITHGFLLDEKGRKMSKSLGNVTDPLQIVHNKGADILRLWVAYEDYQHDVRMGPSILDRVQDIYRRFRNTLRYILGALQGMSPDQWEEPCTMGLLDRWVHHQIFMLEGHLADDLSRYDFRKMLERLHHFCAQDLSAFYFHACKDALYCDGPLSLRRRQIRTTFLHLSIFLSHWLAPFLCFTSEEVWHVLGQDIFGIQNTKTSLDSDLTHDNPSVIQEKNPWLGLLIEKKLWEPKLFWSIHLNVCPEVPSRWCDLVGAAEIETYRLLRSHITASLESARAEKKMGDALQTWPIVHVSETLASIDPLVLAEICTTSGITIVYEKPCKKSISGEEDTIRVDVILAEGNKCMRCWKILMEVKQEKSLCVRCQAVNGGSLQTTE